jgi:DHA2 family multidrug resistance protein-like MFS transporter
MNPAIDAPRATSREWVGLAVLALPCALYAMDLTVLHLAIPVLSQELAPSATELLWIINIYGFLVAGCLITMGTLGERIGRRRMLLLGAGAFAAASALAAFSTSAGMLIATRALLGVAGATVAPSTMSLIRNMFRDPREFTTAVGVWIASYWAGAAIGPVVGGLLLEYFRWGSVFLLAVPVMGLVLVLGPLLLPEYRDPAAGRPDLPGTALAIGAVLAAVYGLEQVAVQGLEPLALAPVVAGVALAGGNVLVGLGLSPMLTLVNDVILSNAPPERAGAASGISETGAELGVALGIAVLGSIGAAIYRAHLATALPAGVAQRDPDVAAVPGE